MRQVLRVVDLGDDFQPVADHHLVVARQDPEDLDFADGGDELPRGHEAAGGGTPGWNAVVTDQRDANEDRQQEERLGQVARHLHAVEETPLARLLAGRGVERELSDPRRRVVDGRCPEGLIRNAFVFGQLDDVDQGAAEFGKLGLDAPRGALQPAVIAQQSPAHHDRKRKRRCQPRAQGDGQADLVEPHEGVHGQQRQQQRRSKSNLPAPWSSRG